MAIHKMTKNISSMARLDFWRKTFFQLFQSKLSLICKNYILQSVWSIFSFGNKLCLPALCSAPQIAVDNSILWNVQESRTVATVHSTCNDQQCLAFFLSHTPLPCPISPCQIFSMYHSVPLHEWPGNLQQPLVSILCPLLPARTVSKYIPSLFP